MKKVLLLFALLCVFISNVTAEGIKTQYRNALIFAYSQANSVYEDDNIKLEIYGEKLWATNKTTKTIFIDLAQCFAFHNGASMPLFNREEKKQGDKKASKVGISTKDNEYITLAPSMGSNQSETYICILSTRIYGDYTTAETPSMDFTDYDKRLLNTLEQLLIKSKEASPKGKEYKGTVAIHMTEDESINNIGASIAYAFNKNTEEWTNVSLSTWVCDVIFAPFYFEIPKDLKKKEKRGFGVKETEHAYIHVRADSPFEFDEDKSPIIVCEWVGNYKKGEFKLNPTWVSKSKKFSAGKIIGAFFTLGLTLVPEVQMYKHYIRFDGAESDWGKMIYALDAMDTRQSN